ncbi:MAG TPA: YlxR family protein [Jatrophihabitantaceae bacterium]|nr:YlxR family protein [Jatrophihabitantaceae bacterium]
MRTCIGCRKRASAAELLRVVVTSGAHGQEVDGPAGESARGPEILSVVPDPRLRAPGRGAWLHPDPGCVELAERRRAFARALRASGPVDPTPVREYVTAATR